MSYPMTLALYFDYTWSWSASDHLNLQAMNGQYLCNRQITVSYAYKKDTKGERHGTPAG
jgi:splicing factor 3B subunit 4